MKEEGKSGERRGGGEEGGEMEEGGKKSERTNGRSQIDVVK